MTLVQAIFTEQKKKTIKARAHIINIAYILMSGLFLFSVSKSTHA